MLPQNLVDYVAFSILMIIFLVFIGIIIYESLISYWTIKKIKSCSVKCSNRGELIED